MEEKTDSPRDTGSSAASLDLAVCILRTALASSWARARAGMPEGLEAGDTRRKETEKGALRARR